MKKSLNINATRDGKKVSKSLGYVNPDVANSIVGGFAQMVNALSNDTFVNAEVVKKMDTSEEEQQGGGSGGKYEPTITLSNWRNMSSESAVVDVSYDGDGQLQCVPRGENGWVLATISGGTATVPVYESDGGDTRNAIGVFFANATDNCTAAVAYYYEID